MISFTCRISITRRGRNNNYVHCARIPCIFPVRGAYTLVTFIVVACRSFELDWSERPLKMLSTVFRLSAKSDRIGVFKPRALLYYTRVHKYKTTAEAKHRLLVSLESRSPLRRHVSIYIYTYTFALRTHACHNTISDKDKVYV